MRVLIDENLPRMLKAALVGHFVQTVQTAGWGGIKNGALLALAESSYDVFVTGDQNLRYQQNLSSRNIAIIELPSNLLSVVRMLVPKVLDALSRIKSGDYLIIESE